LDYCHTYRYYYLHSDSLPNFLNKLKEKKQTAKRHEQAHESVHLFYEPASQQPGVKGVLDDLTSQQRDEIRGNRNPIFALTVLFGMKTHELT